MRSVVLLAGLLFGATTIGANAAPTNLIVNGSFEQGTLGNGAIPGFTKSNTPTNVGSDQPASVIGYNNNNPYPMGAYGEAVTSDNTASASPDPVGNQALYFVGDHSVNETISQLTLLRKGNYKIGFDYYLTANGLANPNDSSLKATIIGYTITATMVTNTSIAKHWIYTAGVGNISLAGYYTTAFVFNSNGYPAKDIVIDRVFAVPTTDAATVFIPPTPTAPAPVSTPEPGAIALLLGGIAAAAAARRRIR